MNGFAKECTKQSNKTILFWKRLQNCMLKAASQLRFSSTNAGVCGQWYAVGCKVDFRVCRCIQYLRVQNSLKIMFSSSNFLMCFAAAIHRRGRQEKCTKMSKRSKRSPLGIWSYWFGVSLKHRWPIWISLVQGHVFRYIPQTLTAARRGGLIPKSPKCDLAGCPNE